MPTNRYIMFTREGIHGTARLSTISAGICELRQRKAFENGMKISFLFQMPNCRFSLFSEGHILLEFEKDFDQVLRAFYDKLCPEGYRYSVESFTTPKRLPPSRHEHYRLTRSQEVSVENIDQYPFRCPGVACTALCELWANTQPSKKRIRFVWVVKHYRFTEDRKTIVKTLVTDMMRTLMEHEAALLIQNAFLKYLYRPGSKFVSQNTSRFWSRC